MRITPRQGGIAVIVILVLVVVILGALTGISLIIYNAGDTKGYERATEELRPKITRAQLERDQAAADRDVALEVNRANAKQLAGLKLEHQAVADQVATLKLQKTTAELKLRQALVKVAETEKRLGTERKVRRLLEIAASPVMTVGACDEADAILRDLAARE